MRIEPPVANLSNQIPLLIAGPTAVGKSEIALRLAAQLGGEIVSVDSMQVYQGLDVGTAKPTTAEQARVKHHLIDVAALTDSFDAAKFVAQAQAAVSAIASRGKIPVFCGGTGLYFKAFLEGLGGAPPTEASLRAALEAMPLVALLAELRTRDPQTFAKIDRKNPRRVVRAVEVIRLTGRPFSEQRAVWAHAPHPTPQVAFGIRRATPDLHARIQARVDEMFQRGLVEETRQLLKLGLAQNPTAMQAIGYRQVVEYLRGERSLPQTIELVKARTRQFAKRQLTWFHKFAALEWIELSTPATLDDAVQRIAERWQAAA